MNQAFSSETPHGRSNSANQAASPPIVCGSIQREGAGSVVAGTSVRLWVSASDLDGTTLDTLYYHWKTSGGTLSDSGAGVSNADNGWTAPTTPGTYTISLIVNDTQYDRYENDGKDEHIMGGRHANDPLNDPPHSEVRLQITVVPSAQKIWKSDSPIAGGNLISPMPDSNNRILVAPNTKLTYAVAVASDSDTWTQDLNGDGIISSNETATQSDSVTYRWSGAGTFANPNSTSTSWTAPSTTGRYFLTCQIDDGAPTVQYGTRNDAAITRTVTVDVFNLSVKADKYSLCAGALASALHQANVTATLLDGAGAPVVGQSVVFSVSSNDADLGTVAGAKRFKLNFSSDTTDVQGQAKVVLNSSQLIGATATVTATFGGVSKKTATITANSPEAPQWGPSPTGLMADGESTAPMTARFLCGGQPVEGHAMKWYIRRIWDFKNKTTIADYVAGDPVRGDTTLRDQYGRIEAANPAETDGGWYHSTFTTGVKAGTVEFGISDKAVYERVQTSSSAGSRSAAGISIRFPSWFKPRAGVDPMVFTVAINTDMVAELNGYAGKALGVKDSRKYLVPLCVKLLTPTSKAPSLDTITVRFYRKAGGTFERPFYLVRNPSDPDGPQDVVGGTLWKYRRSDWDITRLMGRWTLSVVNQQKQKSLVFKINKRAQITELATYWASLNLTRRFYPLGDPISPNGKKLFGECTSFISYIFDHLGLTSIGHDPMGGECGAVKTLPRLPNAPGTTIPRKGQAGDVRIYGEGAHVALIITSRAMADNNSRVGQNPPDPLNIYKPGPTITAFDSQKTRLEYPERPYTVYLPQLANAQKE